MYCGSLNIVLHLFTSYQQYQLSQHGPVSYHLWKENRNNVCTHMCARSTLCYNQVPYLPYITMSSKINQWYWDIL